MSLDLSMQSQPLSGSAPASLPKLVTKQSTMPPGLLDEDSPALRRAIKQARAKRGPIVLIQAGSDAAGSDEDEVPALAADNDSSSSSGSSDDESDSDAECIKVGRPHFYTLRNPAATAPAHIQNFPEDVSAEHDASEPESNDVVEQYRKVVIHDDHALLQLSKERVARKGPASAAASKPAQSDAVRSSTYWTRKEAAIQWIKDQWAAAVQEEQAPAPVPAPAQKELAPVQPPTLTRSDSAPKKALLSALSPEEQRKAMEEHASGARSLSARRASTRKSLKRLPTLDRIQSHVAAVSSPTLKAEPTPPVTARIAAPSPGSPSLGWAATLCSTLALPTPRIPFIAQCGQIEIRITPPTPRAPGFAGTSFKVPGVVLRHSLAPPPGSQRFVPGSPRQFADQQTLAPPPFDVAPGRNIIMQKRAEAQLEQLKAMARQQMAAQDAASSRQKQQMSPAAAQAQVARTVADAVAARFGPRSGSGSSPSSPSTIPDSPLPPRAGLNMPRRGVTLQQATAVDSPVRARTKCVYIPPGRNGYRAGQLRAHDEPTSASAAEKYSSMQRERREVAGRAMLNRLGQRSAVPATPQTAI